MNASTGDSVNRLDAAPAPASDSPELAWRVLRLLNVYRSLVALVVLVLHLAGDSAAIGSIHPWLLRVSVVAYLGLTIVAALALLKRWPPLPVQLIGFTVMDIAVVTIWLFASGGVVSGIGSVLIVSVGAASLATERRTAATLAAIASLALLGQQAALQLTGAVAAAEYTPAGVLGAIIFIVALAFNPLARRIRESEALARQRGVDLANLGQLNEYIIQHLRESIVVVDGDDRIRLINESAAQHLGTAGRSAGVPLEEVSPRLLRLVQNWRQNPRDPFDETISLVSADGSTLIQPQFAPIGIERPTPLLIFLEDMSRISERVQQSKLASLGRLSASIAHEIRNPVGAMSHAGQLLGESPLLGAEERRLTDIIHSNAQRVSSIIDSILHLSRRDTTRPERVELQAWLERFVAEFSVTMEVEAARFEIAHDEAALEVRMDPTHLHQVTWNLCENALRYAGNGNPIRLHSSRMPSTGRPYLEVADRGPGINAETAERIFEPFFTGQHGGTGLGLYISRELRQCNRATLLYEPRQGGGSIFRVIFADPQRWEI